MLLDMNTHTHTLRCPYAHKYILSQNPTYMNIFAHNNHIIMNANMQIYNDRISVSNIKKKSM